MCLWVGGEGRGGGETAGFKGKNLDFFYGKGPNRAHGGPTPLTGFRLGPEASGSQHPLQEALK